MAQAAEISLSPPHSPPSPIKVGMIVFLSSEVAFFGTLIMTYIYFMRQSAEGNPSPREVFSLPMVLIASACLFSSSGTIHMAEKALRRSTQAGFLAWWGLTIVLGIAFLLFTANEWRDLIVTHHLTISRNLFGTTYFTLVGFHAFHVTIGVITMSVVWSLAQRRQITVRNMTGVEVVSWYWHFVDAVWVAVFLLVYIVGPRA